MRLFFLFTFLFFSYLSFGQTIKGKVVDQSGNPLEFASVSIPKYSTGTLTNKDGNFIIYNCKISDTIVFAYVGYKSDTILLQDLNSINIILSPVSYNLNEIIISNISAKSVVNTAIKKIPDNYLFTNNNVEGFYRESLFTNDTLTLMTESQLLVTFPENSNKKGEIRVLKKRSFKGNIKDYLINGPLTVLEMNEIFKKFAFSNTFFDRLKFQFKNSYFENDVRNQIISFHLDQPFDSKLINGELSVNMEDYGINFYSLTVENLNNHKVTHNIASYKKINEKYLLESFVQESKKNTKQKGFKNLSGKIQYTTTNYCCKSPKEGNSYYKGENLENYENSLNENFWNDIDYILVDSMLEVQILNLIRQSKINTNTKKSDSYIALYQPQLAYQYSINGFKDIENLNFNMNGFNRLVYYYSSEKIKNGIVNSLVQQLWALFSITFQEVETERRLYKDLGYNTKYNPFFVNPFYKTFSYGLTDNDLNAIKTTFPTHFIRAQTIRLESNNASIKKIEEELFNVNFSDNQRNKNEFLKFYFLDYFTRKTLLSWEILFSGFEKNYPTYNDKSKLPFSFN